jgi:hypothetical protein
VYEKLHNKFTSTYPAEWGASSVMGIVAWAKNSTNSSSARRLSAATAAHLGERTKSQSETSERANKCLLSKQIIFKLFHQKFPLH